MEYIIKENVNYKNLTLEEKLKKIKVQIDAGLGGLNIIFDSILNNTKSVMIEVIDNGEQFKLLLDDDSVLVYNLEDLGALIKKVNKKADYEDIIQYIIHLLNCNYSELDIKLVECLNSNTSNEKLKKITGLWLDGVRKEEMIKELHMADVKRLGEYMVVTGIDLDKVAKEMNDTFMNSDDIDLRIKAGDWLLNNIFGNVSETLDEASFEIDDILYKKLKPIKDVIRKKINSYVSVGSSYIKLNGDIKEDTKKMFDYVMDCTNIYDKAYVMQSVIDRVLSVYFDTLKEINKDINIL